MIWNEGEYKEAVQRLKDEHDRLAAGLTQRELAAKLQVDESQVSRDERNEYHGVSVDRAVRILDALGVQLVSEIRGPIAGSESDPDLVTS